MGVPRMTVTYTLQMPLNRPRTGFLCPVRCWSWAVRMGLLDAPLYYLNNAVWDLLSAGTGYIDRIAYSVYYAAAGTVV